MTLLHPADAAANRFLHLPGWRLALLLIAAQCLALLLLAFMLLNKHGSLLDELTLSRMETQAAELETALRIGVLSGLRPHEITPLQAMVNRLRQSGQTMARIDVIAVADVTARIVFADDPQRMGDPLSADEWRVLSAGNGFVRQRTDAGPQLSATVRDAADEIAGALRLRAATAPLVAARESTAIALAWTVAAAGVLMFVLTLSGLHVLRRRTVSLRLRLTLVALVSTLAAGAFVAWEAKNLFAQNLTPAIRAKVAGVTGLLAGKIERASQLGIPLAQIPRLAETFADLIARHPEIAALRLSDRDGRTIAEFGDDAHGEWIARRAGDAHLAAATDEDFIARRLGEMSIDIAIVLLAFSLVFRELLTALVSALPAARPALHALRSLRLPLFLLILTEELSRAFLPLYLKTFTRGDELLAADTAVSVPIAVYMLCFAVATPFAGRATDQWGVHKVFAAGVAMTTAGFAWMAVATAYWELLPARALCACGYASGTIACQRQLIVLSTASERARGLALFVAAVGIAAICGAALGGVLAEQFGDRTVLCVSALLAVLALAAFGRTPQGAAGQHASSPPLRLAEVRRLLGDRRFLCLLLGAAVPAKVALAGLLFYLAPLALNDIGYHPAAIGRSLMLYFVLIAAVNPLASGLSDRFGWRLSLTLTGGIVIGLGSLAVLVEGLSAEQAVLLAIAGLGIGSGLATAPMQALASEIGAATGATSVAVVLRTIERLGSAIGPLWVSVWLVADGWRAALVASGATILVATALCLGARKRENT